MSHCDVSACVIVFMTHSTGSRTTFILVKKREGECGFFSSRFTDIIGLVKGCNWVSLEGLGFLQTQRTFHFKYVFGSSKS